MGMWIALVSCGMAAGILVARAYYRAEMLYLRNETEDLYKESYGYRVERDKLRSQLNVKCEEADRLRGIRQRYSDWKVEMKMLMGPVHEHCSVDLEA